MAEQRVESFAWQLQQQVTQLQGPREGAGFFLSPASLYIALGLAMSGSGSSSATQEEIYHLLHQDKSRLLGLLQPKAASETDVQDLTHSIATLSGSLLQQDDAGEVEMIIANAVWTNKVEVRAEYAAEMLKLFQAEVRQADTADVVNQWAAKVTKGLIKQALPPGMPFDLVLTNAVYFKGLWEYAFDKKDTSKQGFKPDQGPEVQVDMMFKSFKSSDMTNKSRPIKFVQTSSYQAVRLPYKGSTVSAVLVLPSSGLAQHGTAAAVTKLDIHELLADSKYSPVGHQGLTVHLPKFKVQTECVSLKQHLQGLGIQAAFQESADFSKLSAEPLFISDVLQSVCVIVDETGTEAAAVTSVVMLRCGLAVGPPPVVIKFDRPFLFMLVDDASSTPLFVGTVEDPSKAK